MFNVYMHCGVAYNPPENKSEITNNYQICATTIKNTLNPVLPSYDGKYMLELFLTLPELENKRTY